MSRFIDELLCTAKGVGQTRGIVVGEPNQPARWTWAEIHHRARVMASALIDAEVRRGSVVGVLAGAPALIVVAAQAVWLSGGSVTVLHQPTPRTDLHLWVHDTVATLGMINSDLVLLAEPFEELAPALAEHGIDSRTIGHLTGAPICEPVPTAEDDLALLQLTSGSTAEPKAVQITHANLMANMHAMVDRAQGDPYRDVFVSWLPTFHDMGMVGFLILPMAVGFELVKITPIEFLTKPLIWADLITKYRGTVTAAPNFAYAIMAKRLAAVKDDHRFDFSTMRIMMSGAEPINPADVAAFTIAAQRFGLDPRSIVPADGMAEVTVAASFEINRGLETDAVEARALETDGRAVPIPTDVPRPSADKVRVLAKLGRPLPGLEVRIVDDQGDVLAQREVGEIQLRGASISPGYLTLDGPVDARDADGWLATGDLGYLADGQLVICGRRKDVIIVGGRNIYPTDIERSAATADGVRENCVVAVRTDPNTEREQFAVILESPLAGNDEAEKELAFAVSARVAAAVDARPHRVLVVPKGSLPKTPSGKLRRAATAARFADRLSRVASS
jgi:fatty-acyl-CoA synthase